MTNYEEHITAHEGYISLEELRKVCRISPRSARYLVENGIIPAIDTGKRTWRYQISVDDVVTYLEQREILGSMIPTGAVSSRKKKSTNTANGKRKSFSQYIASGDEHEVAEYFNYVFSDLDDVLTTRMISTIIGLNKNTVLKLIKSGQLRSLTFGKKYLIPKQYLLQFVVTPQFLEARSNTAQFLKVIGEFDTWMMNKTKSQKHK